MKWLCSSCTRMNESTGNKEVKSVKVRACSTRVWPVRWEETRSGRGEGGTCKTALSLWQHNGVLFFFFFVRKGRLILHVCSHKICSGTNPHSGGKWNCSRATSTHEALALLTQSSSIFQPASTTKKQKYRSNFLCRFWQKLLYHIYFFKGCCLQFNPIHFFCQIQQISAHSLLAVCSVRVLEKKKNPVLFVVWLLNSNINKLSPGLHLF